MTDQTDLVLFPVRCGLPCYCVFIFIFIFHYKTSTTCDHSSFSNLRYTKITNQRRKKTYLAVMEDLHKQGGRPMFTVPAILKHDQRSPPYKHRVDQVKHNVVADFRRKPSILCCFLPLECSLQEDTIPLEISSEHQPAGQRDGFLMIWDVSLFDNKCQRGISLWIFAPLKSH